MNKIGLDAKLYRNKGSYETPDWEEVANVKDVSVTMEAGEAEVTTRASGGWKQYLTTLLDGGVEFEMVWDSEDEGFAAIKDAFFGRTGIEFAVMDGDITTPGSEGLRATMAVTKFSRKEPLAEAMTVDVSIKPTRADNPPEWLEVGGSGIAAGTIALTGLPADGNAITIGDGVNTPKTFEFDDDASVTPGNIPIVIGESAAATMVVLVAAINAAVPLAVTASPSSPPDADCTLENDTAGAHGNVPILKTGANITVTGMSGG